MKLASYLHQATVAMWQCGSVALLKSQSWYLYRYTVRTHHTDWLSSQLEAGSRTVNLEYIPGASGVNREPKGAKGVYTIGGFMFQELYKKIRQPVKDCIQLDDNLSDAIADYYSFTKTGKAINDAPRQCTGIKTAESLGAAA